MTFARVMRPVGQFLPLEIRPEGASGAAPRVVALLSPGPAVIRAFSTKLSVGTQDPQLLGKLPTERK